MRRFAGGDFRPRVLESGDASDLGALVAAYNGAAAQVSAAFSERERNDQRLRLILGEAGHEMRTPLTVISAYLDLLDGNVHEEQARRDRALAMVRSETRRLRELVERVMALARLDGAAEGTELVDLVPAVKDAVAEIVAARGGRVDVHAPQDDLVVNCDPWTLRAAVGNLVDNALKYGAGTLVDVTVALLAGDVVVRVSDCGPGIAPDDRERLFHHFFRGEHAVGTTGSGLGLAIVARAAERLGGEVVLERPGPPVTTFRLSLPAYRHAAQPHCCESARLRPGSAPCGR